ncbi:MAG: hypothetical protein FWG05_02495 [Kiritimatiellaeota bacterium]|nr:hypothetical protein [Kiritimatiellota bacterium]
MSKIHKSPAIAAIAALAAGCVGTARAETLKFGFDKQEELSKASVSGGASVDSSKFRGGGASLKVPPKSSVEIKISPTDIAGKVEFYVFEDMTQPKDPKAYHVGPRWGLKQADGRVVVVGNLFAHYLGGDSTYTASEVGGAPVNWFSKVTYLSGLNRSSGWRKWLFDFDPNKGLTLHMDGKYCDRFKWNESQMKGFCSIVFLGDDGDGGQTIWIDDLTASSAGAMKIAPIPPAPPKPPEPVVPEKDPPATKTTRLAYPSLTEHPRLLFTKSEIPRMKSFVEKTDEGKMLFDKLMGYRVASKPDRNAPFQTDATDGQRQGLWKLPTVALHYVLTGDKRSLDDVKGFLEHFANTDPWEKGGELDSGMSSANICIGAALAFDWCYNDLDPAFREKFRKLLWEKARRQYHGGHLMKNPGVGGYAVGYWQNDPQNNHRWHRDAGMVLCALAAARGTPDEQWLLGEIANELDFIAKWLPDDGTSHESASYLTFGGPHLALAIQAGDRGFGTKHLQTPFFKSVGDFRIHSLLPGLKDGFSYGDGAGLHFYNGFLWLGAGVHKQAALTGALTQWRDIAPGAFLYAWMDIIWRNPDVKPGKITEYPTAGFFSDIGTLFIRDSWDADAVGAMFKCGPMGGYTLNKFRNENGFHYINVAHDDPDANSFTIVKGGSYLAETDRYSTSKKSANHNTILINGVGQENFGRPEGGQWTQPATGNTDMTKQAVITAYKRTPAITLIEGEASGSYLAKNGVRPALDRYRRTFVWVEGKYILVLDDIRAPEKVKIDWLLQGRKIDTVDAPAMRYKLVSDSNETCAFQITADKTFTKDFRAASADDHGKALGHRQMVLNVEADKFRVASVYAPWGGDVTLRADWSNPTTAKITILKDGKDAAVWQWQTSTSQFAPSSLSTTGFSLTPADKVQ